MMIEYLVILIALFLIALLIKKSYNISIYHNKKEGLMTVGLFFLVGVIFDTFAISRDYWLFPQENNIGVNIGLMPIEEYLFMLIIPYFIIVIYKAINRHQIIEKNCMKN